jgi:hypothetical protein
MKNLSKNTIAKAAVVLITATLLLLALGSAGWADDRVTGKLPKFSDVPQSHWAALHITRLTYEGAINGYPDGTFKPGNNITRAEFLAVVVGALQNRPEAPPVDQHWATNIIKAAEKSNLLEPGEFAADTWGNPINRQEMAKIMARAMQYVRKEAAAERTSVYTSKVTDFNALPESYRPYVAQVYAKGIVTGYPDGTFGGVKQATRAEAATMIVRLIDPVYRITATATAGSDIAFNPATDVAADGRMKLAKAEEYLMKNVQSLRFFTEGGKYYFEGYVTEVPLGFENRISIRIIFKPGTGLPIASYNTIPYRAVIELPTVGPFNEEIKGIGNLDQINYVTVTTSINAINHTNATHEKASYEVCWIFASGNDNRIDVINCIGADKESHKFYDLSKIFQW